MADVLQMLLAADTEKIQERPTKQIEMKRLSALLGEPTIFTAKALTAAEYDTIQEKAYSLLSKNKNKEINANLLQTMIVIEGIKEPNLKDKELREKFGVPTPKELVEKLLAPGEIINLFNIISELSGFGEDVIDEIKNA
ncbi:MAG: XkdN-like protein [Clostridia bacterium]|nr:XkdN-like protein [Clostridia bacterium]